MANSGWLVLEDKQEQKQTKGLVKLYKVRGQSFGVCAVYCGDNVQWTKMIEDVPQNWSTTLRTIFEDQWSGNLEEDINTAFPMFDGNIEYHNNSSYIPQNLVQSFPVIYILFNFVYNEMSRCVFEQIIKYADLVELPPIA